MRLYFTIAKKAVKCFAVVAVFVAMFLLLDNGLKRQEAVECIGWQKQTTQFEGFEFASWQEQQCNHQTEPTHALVTE